MADSNEQELLALVKDAVRWLDAIEQRMGIEMIACMPNNCLGRPAMRQAIARMES